MPAVQKISKLDCGFSLVELLTGLAIAAPILLGAGFVLVEGAHTAKQAEQISQKNTLVLSLQQGLFTDELNCKDHFRSNFIPAALAMGAAQTVDLMLDGLDSQGFPDPVGKNSELDKYSNLKVEKLELNNFQNIGKDGKGRQIYKTKMEISLLAPGGISSTTIIAEPTIAVDAFGKIVECRAAKSVAADGTCDTNAAKTSCRSFYDAVSLNQPNCAANNNILTGLTVGVAPDMILNCKFAFATAACGANKFMRSGVFVTLPGVQDCPQPIFANIVN